MILSVVGSRYFIVGSKIVGCRHILTGLNWISKLNCSKRVKPFQGDKLCPFSCRVTGSMPPPPRKYGFLHPLRCHFFSSDSKYHFFLAADQTNNAYLKMVPKCCFLCIYKQVKFIKSSKAQFRCRACAVLS